MILLNIYYICRPKYQKLFDPRTVRAAVKGPTAQAEHVVGTHLYAHLQELPSPLAQPHPSNSAIDSISEVTTGHYTVCNADKWAEYYSYCSLH